MKRRLLTTALLSLIVTVVFFGGYAFGQSNLAPFALFGPASATPDDAEQAFQPFWEAWRFIQSDYFEQPLDNTRLAEGAIEGMLATLDDPNTRYLSPVAEQAARSAMEGNIEGIGAEVSGEGGVIAIVAPYEGSPAAQAGLRPGDIIREADGVSLTGMDIGEAVTLVRGPAGTSVHLVIERDGEIFDVDVVRDVIRIPSVYGELLEDDIAYLRLSRFANNTAEELSDVLDSLIERDPQGLILDLRSNPGGGLTTAVDVADQFLESGPILIERFGNGRESLFEAGESGSAENVPLVVLIDQGSASASEVLAGAIRDSSRGILIGDNSFGKGTVQTWKQLSNGGGIRITIARWLTPEGTWVHGEGLTPDFSVSLPQPEDGEVFTDTQLEAAIDYLLGRPVTETSTDGPGG